MSDYTQGTFFTPKDSLAPGDANKTVRGTEIDTELGRIETAIATKYDVTDLATTPEAEAGALNTVLMTPALVAANVAADAMLVPAGRLVSTGTGMSGGGDLSADRTLALDTGSALNADHSAISVIAGEGITGGGTLEADRTLDLDIDSLTEAVPTSGDFFLYYDDSASDHKKVDFDDLIPDTRAYSGVTGHPTQADNDIVDSTYTALDCGQPTNPTRFVVPAGKTKIAVSAVVTWEGNATGDRQIMIYINGVLSTITPKVVNSVNGYAFSVTTSLPRSLVTGLVAGTGYIEVVVYHTAGANIYASAGNNSVVNVEYLD